MTTDKYNAICKTLGFRAAIHFVKVTNHNTITFTAGKPDEIKSLYASVLRCGLKPAASLVHAATR